MACSVLRKALLQSQSSFLRCAYNAQRLRVNGPNRASLLRPFSSSRQFNFPKAVPYLLSDIGEGIVEVVVKEWYVKEGDPVAQFDPVCEVQSDKASVTITSRFDGKIGTLHYNVDDVAKVGKPLLDIIVPDDSVPDSTPDVKEKTVHEVKVPSVDITFDESVDKALATPAVRRIAKENNVNLKDVRSTGKGGRVLKEDIMAHLGLVTPAAKGPAPVSPTIPKVTRTGVISEDWTEAITGIRKAMAKTMTQAWKVPHFTYSDEMDVSALVEFRKKSQPANRDAGFKVTPLAYLLKATSQALLKYPRLNAHVDAECSMLTVRSSHNLGVAIDTPSGLIVPNIKNVEQLSIVEIAKELGRLQSLAQESRLTPGELQGGSLTLSNIGAIGGTVATPVLLPPQIVIGALGKIQKLPRFDKNGNVVAVDLMSISWSADHRVVDGATIARFSNLFKLLVASPELLLTL